MTTLYLVWHEPISAGPAFPSIAWEGDAHPLNDMMWLVRSELTLSKLYHAVKWQLPEGIALMVAPLEDRPGGWPKFKNMEPGALAWLRRQGN
jgi:hypothetical protein